jgi:hypothetical protein
MIIGFSTPKKFNLFSWLITKVIGSKYSHAFMCFPIPEIGARVVYEANRHGVNAISFDKWKEKNKIIDFIEVENQEVSNRAHTFAIDHLHVRYSTIAILAIALNIRFRDGTRSMICSEFVGRAAGVKIKNIDTLDPKELLAYLKRNEDDYARKLN